MADESSTPSLDRMPTEMIRMIGWQLYDEEPKDLTLVSKRFRLIFVPRYLRMVKFCGSVPQIAFQLKTIISFEGLIWQYIEQVEIALLAGQIDNAQGAYPSCHSGFGILDDFLRKTTQLKHIVVLLCRFKAPLDQFVNLIGNTQGWPRTERVFMGNSTPMLVDAITLGSDTPDDLKPLSEDEIYKWYASIILRISSAVPRLEQISITHAFPHFYRGIKNSGEEEMAVSKGNVYDEPNEDFEFPGYWYHEEEKSYYENEGAPVG
ncbi:hypothetical protein F53441_1069 [Fusarium austroafricanum]|uniref:F-box domain-containing protein n=1 Tax=Fusarium austroafricanum TaxID=2364996 RepID=A0A8H4P4F2_9HYPO|nr:hypothetical protein F53441_1069 [Fusarium austroafricanum]